MKRLILLRHAKTERRAESGEDFDRALTERGRRDAALAGRLLCAAGLIPDLALVSAARRAHETWEEAKVVLPDAHLEVRPDLYEAPAVRLLQAAEAATDARTVMVIAHNPGIQVLALELASSATLIDAEVKARIGDGFSTGSSIAFEIERGRVGCLGLFVPRDHGGGGDE